MPSIKGLVLARRGRARSRLATLTKQHSPLVTSSRSTEFARSPPTKAMKKESFGAKFGSTNSSVSPTWSIASPDTVSPSSTVRLTVSGNGENAKDRNLAGVRTPQTEASHRPDVRTWKVRAPCSRSPAGTPGIGCQSAVPL